jgi:predicted CoA-binding protein
VEKPADAFQLYLIMSSTIIESKKTLVLGASPKASRYSYTAVDSLVGKGHEVIAVGVREGQIRGIEIQTDLPQPSDLHTITLYLNPKRQEQYYDYILSLAPKRIIFNPGTENPELVSLAKEKGIETENACTLVMLAIGNY